MACSWESRTRSKSHQKGNQIAMESSEVAVVILPVLTSIRLSLPGSALTTLGLAWLTTISVRRGRPGGRVWEELEGKNLYYLAGCDRKSTSAGHRPGVRPEEEKAVLRILRELVSCFRDLSR